MKILLWSCAFQPSIGGLEAVSLMLANEFVHKGHQVTVVTRTPSSEQDELPFSVVRCPDWRQLLRLVRDCDVYLQNHVSVKAAWPLLLAQRPWVVAHQNWIPSSWVHKIAKHFVLQHADSISCSKAIASALPVPSVIIPNPYDDHTFRLMPGVSRDRDLIFVGRLVADKGVHILLEAVHRLRSCHISATVTITGAGPEAESLLKQAHSLGLAKQVEFTGPKSGRQLATLLNRHRIQVVPSVWREPFGIAALEGIACGCVLVGSEEGGLRDAIGPCGVTFPNGDVCSLTEQLEHLLRQPSAWVPYLEAAENHLKHHVRSVVADSYLAVLTARNDSTHQ